MTRPPTLDTEEDRKSGTYGLPNLAPVSDLVGLKVMTLFITNLAAHFLEMEESGRSKVLASILV